MANIDGTSVGETLTGTSDADVIRGFGGNDSLDGLGGADRLEGGLGDDAYYVDHLGDQTFELAGEGYDSVFASVSYALIAGSEIELLSTSAFYLSNAMNLTGNEFVQLILGNQGVNNLDGGGGADVLVGYGGNDNYFIDNAGDLAIEALGEGYDAVYASVSYALTNDSEVEFIGTNAFYLSGAINLVGNNLANEIYGNQGTNILDGGAGADFLVAFGGDDSYFVDNAGDLVIEAIGGGYDAIFASVNYALTNNSEVEFIGTSAFYLSNAINLVGNNLANQIYGNQGTNSLDGAGGADLMTGFGGDDSYYVDDAGDLIVEAVGQGYDAVFTAINYALTNGAEVEFISTTAFYSTYDVNLAGNELNNALHGNQGSNSLDGGGGVDAMTGYGGNDNYYVDQAGDVVVEAANEGFDALFASASYTLAQGVSIEFFSTTTSAGTAAINLTGNDIAQSIYGNAGANVIDGGLGADTLNGLGGQDIFAFTTALGAGNIDTIADFSTVDDTIRLGGAAGQPFAALATGALRVGTLVIGAAAADADDYLIYNSGTGALLYDADGNGAGAAVQFATLATGLGLTVADFIVSGALNTAPAITSGATASIAENSATNIVVYQTAASDADGDRITYSLSGADAGLLTIDANGAVRLRDPANFEAKAVYSFNVVASDSGTSTQKAITLTITDVNENANTPVINEIAASNNTQGTAQSLDPGAFLVANNPNLYNDDYPSVTIVGSVSSPADANGVSDDVDFYSITLQAGQQLILDVDFTNGLDAFLTLYGPNGAVLFENDDQGDLDPGSNPPFPHNTDSLLIVRAPTTGTYYFSIESFNDGQGPTSLGAYQLHVSINPVPATPQQILAEDVEALISGSSWNHTNLTFGFPTSASQYPQDFDEVADPNGPLPPAPPTFEAFTALQQSATRSLLQMIANVSELTFQERTGTGNYTNSTSAASADLRFAESSEADVAYAYYPNNGGADDVGGSAWFNHEDFDDPFRGNYAWMGILHETGHALGLKHGHETPLAISVDHDSLEYSVMTYRAYPGDNVAGGYNNEEWGYPQTLMMLDIAALQKIYDGANYTYNSGASTYTWSATTGEMSINGVGQGAPGNGAGGSANRILMTVWDGNGNDTYDLSNYSTNTTIDLRPGEWTTTSTAQLANLGVSGGPHLARGNVANALLFEGDVRSAIENAKGGSGADTLIANLVANQFTGNGGADIFKWMAAGDAGTGSLADTVLDFVRGTDKIDFSNLDANAIVPGQQDFAFIGTGAFSGAAGQVRYEVTGGSAHIFADADGNGSADMEIILTNITVLAATDFNF